MNAGPTDRTAYETIIPADAPQERKDALASALAGSAVGPVFPRYFAMQAACGVLALVAALVLGPGPRLAAALVLGWSLLALAVIVPLCNYLVNRFWVFLHPGETRIAEPQANR